MNDKSIPIKIIFMEFNELERLVLPEADIFLINLNIFLIFIKFKNVF